MSNLPFDIHVLRYANLYHHADLTKATLHATKFSRTCGDICHAGIWLKHTEPHMIGFRMEACLFAQASAGILLDHPIVDLKNLWERPFVNFNLEDFDERYAVLKNHPTRLQCINLPIEALRLAMNEK
ncbi:MAG: hypothetical protein ACON5C_09720 [Alphaproteobacteria bacterium]